METLISERNKNALFVIVFALVFYVAGASFVQSFVNYPTWHLIGSYEFQEYHKAMSSRIIQFMVIPWLVEVILTFALMRFRPQSIPLPLIEFAQGFNFIALISTIVIQIPIQVQLEQTGLSMEALDKLMASDPIRWCALILKAALYFWMMSRLVNGSSYEAEYKDTPQGSATTI